MRVNRYQCKQNKINDTKHYLSNQRNQCPFAKLKMSKTSVGKELLEQYRKNIKIAAVFGLKRIHH
jgi:hypothetical protein